MTIGLRGPNSVAGMRVNVMKNRLSLITTQYYLFIIRQRLPIWTTP